MCCEKNVTGDESSLCAVVPKKEEIYTLFIVIGDIWGMGASAGVFISHVIFTFLMMLSTYVDFMRERQISGDEAIATDEMTELLTLRLSERAES